MILLVAMSLFSVWDNAHLASAVPYAAGRLDSQALVDKLRHGSGKGDGRLQYQHVTTVLPDSPFIQLRSEPDSLPERGNKDNPKIVKLRQGKSAVLRCEVLGMPSPVAYWTRNGLPVLGDDNGPSDMRQSGNVVEMLENSGRPTLEHAATIAKLKLTCVTPSDAGLYACNGDNGVDKVIAYTKVIVEPVEGPDAIADEPTNSDRCPSTDQNESSAGGPPIIYMYTDMRLEYPGNDAQLVCRAEGHPRPTVRWFDSNEMLIGNGQNFTVLDTGDLLVRRINFGIHQPFRQFVCQALNALGDDKAAVDLLAISRSK